MSIGTTKNLQKSPRFIFAFIDIDDKMCYNYSVNKKRVFIKTLFLMN